MLIFTIIADGAKDSFQESDECKKFAEEAFEVAKKSMLEEFNKEVNY